MAKNLRLTRVTVEGLFGYFDHDIPLNNSDRITIIIAPNGYGKTVLLKLIDAFYKAEFDNIFRIPFDKFTLCFDNGQRLKIYPVNQTDLFKDSDGTQYSEKALNFDYSGHEEGGDVLSWPYIPNSDPLLLYIDSHLDFLDRAGPERWYDNLSDEFLDYQEVVDRYSEHFPSGVLRRNVPEWLVELQNSLDCRFIETQRLLDLSSEDDTPRRRRLHRRFGKEIVNHDAEDLARQIRLVLTEYAATSQRLDQDFPRRVIQEPGSGLRDEKTLREELSTLEDKRAQLVEVGILDKTTGQLPLSRS